MHIFLTILSIVGWVLLGLLALVLLLLIVPARLRVRWNKDGLAAKLYILFVPIKLLPKAKKPKKTAKKPTKKKQPAQNKPKKPAEEKKKMQLTFETIVSLASDAGTALKIALKGLKIKDIELVWPIHKEEAADTATAFGTAQALLATGVATLENLMRLYFKRVDFIPDFADDYRDMQSFSCKIVASPIIIVIAGVYFLKRLFDEKII